MQKPDVAALTSMLRAYGSYAVVSEITKYMEEQCKGSYASSPDSVIHRDLPVMQSAVAKMKTNHPLREL